MKILDRIGLALFSSLMLIISIIVCLMIFGWLNVDLVHQLVVMAINDSVSSNIMLGLSIVFILLAIKCIFFDSSSKQEMDYKNGILLENSDGKLLGVVSGDIFIDEIIKLVEESKVDDKGYSFLIDGDGYILAHPEYKYDEYSQIKNINNVLFIFMRTKIKRKKDATKKVTFYFQLYIYNCSI